jgi:DNA-binding HxlR family transcriptional regulator
MSIRYGQFCPIAKAAEILGERWTILIIRELLVGTKRFNDLQRALSQISPTLLTKRLTQLEDCGLVIRKTIPGPRRIEYHLTLAGRQLRPVVMGLGKWGMKWARGQMTDDELDVEMLMSEISRRIDATQLPGGRTVIEFIFTDLSKFRRWWVVIEDDGERELCVENPRKETDILIRADVRTMVEIWAGDTDIRTAKKGGRLHLQGHPDLIRSVTSWLRGGLYASVRRHPDSIQSLRPVRTKAKTREC